jgi:hypothetical protein
VDVRLTLDLALQRAAEELLAGRDGALIFLRAEQGDILVMASHPTFDPDELDQLWEGLVRDERAPLLNRVTQGSYPSGGLLETVFPGDVPEGLLVEAPAIRLPVGESDLSAGNLSPLQAALALAPLSNAGRRPAARIAQAYREPEDGWTLFPPLGAPLDVLPAEGAEATAGRLAHPDLPIWELGLSPPDEALTWYAAGSLPDAEAEPVVLILALEERNLPLAEEIGRAVLLAAMGP